MLDSKNQDNILKEVSFQHCQRYVGIYPFLLMQVILTKKFRFEAAQTVPHITRCNKMHGHSFKIEISVKGEKNETTGYFCDHAIISKAMKPLLDLVDHSYLNDLEGLKNPTIENMCGWFWEKLAPHLPGLYEIVIHETPKARCTYRGE